MYKRQVSEEETRSKIAENISFSLHHINAGRNPSLKNIENLKLLSPEDEKIRENLLSILKKDPDKVSQEELILVVNNLMYLAQKEVFSNISKLENGEQLKKICSSCSDAKLLKYGIKYSLSTVTDKTLQDVNVLASRVINKGQMAMRNYIKKNLTVAINGKTIQIGTLAKMRKTIKRSDYPDVVIFIHILKHGNSKQKELAEAILKISKEGKGYNLFSSKNRHAFYKLPELINGPNDYSRWIHLTKRIEIEMDQTNQGTIDSHYNLLQRDIDNITDLNKRATKQLQLDLLKKRKCFEL